MSTAGEDTTNSLGGNGGDGGGQPGLAKPPLLDVGGSTVFDSATQALSGRTLDGELVSGGAGGGVVIVISASPQPAGLTLSAAGGVDIGSGTGPGETGTTRWLN